jgi:hypothetical protein
VNHQQKLERIRELFAAHDDVLAQLDALHPALNPDPGCELYSAIFGLLDVAINATAAALGDNSNWLEWMVNENECGRRGHEAGYSNALKPIRTAEDLLDLIEDNDANSE